MAARAVAVVVIGLLLGCSDDETRGTSSGTGGAGGDDGCPEGAITIDGACVVPGEDAGIGACGAGFERDGDGCAPILPRDVCAPGQIAIPGDAACREIAPCGDTTWGDIPVDATTEYVDASFTGASDGSSAAPWPTVQQAIDAADSGAIIAIAEGSYVEDLLIDGKPVTLWGRCPARTVLEGTGAELGAVSILSPTPGIVIRGVAITGAGAAVVSFGTEGLEIREVWIHDLPTRAINLQGDDGPMSASVVDSLIEGARQYAIFASGSAIAVERSWLRGTRAGAGQIDGPGIYVGFDSGVRGSLVLRGSLVEDHELDGVVVQGSDAEVEDTVIRDTQPFAASGAFGVGLSIEPAGAEPADVVLRRSVLQRNRYTGVAMSSSSLLMEDSTIEGTLPQVSDDDLGSAIAIQTDDPTLVAQAHVLRSSLRDNQTISVIVTGANATFERTVVRNTQPGPSQELGFGVQIVGFSGGGLSADVALRSCRIDDNTAVGLVSHGATVAIDDTSVRRTVPRPSDGLYGWGISLQPELDTPTHGVITASAISDNHEIGIATIDSQLELDLVQVSGTLAATDGLFGDGVGAFSLELPTSLVLSRLRSAHNARAGISLLGVTMSLADSSIACNVLSIAAEDGPIGPFDLSDAGGNDCGCDQPKKCKVESAEVYVPAPLDDPP